MSDETFRCSICKNYFTGFGNNAEPLAHGRCCNDCDMLVVQYRINLILRR